MPERYYEIKDQCRIGLLKYLEKVCAGIPKENHANILDIGCGTGVPTLWMASNFEGSITAIDRDREPLLFLQQKIVQNHLQDKVQTQNISFFDFECPPESFDIILAEGFLNVVGFEAGFRRIKEILKPGGYIVIHDEFKNHDDKVEFISNCNCTVTDILYMDEHVWWNDYYRQLNDEILQNGNENTTGRFASDIEEIQYYKIMPSLFRSIYYVVKKTPGFDRLCRRASTGSASTGSASTSSATDLTVTSTVTSTSSASTSSASTGSAAGLRQA